MRFPAFLQNKLRTKEHRSFLHSRKCSFHLIFDLSATQSIPTTNEQMMKSKLRTFACKQILRKPIKKRVKEMAETQRSHNLSNNHECAFLKTHNFLLRFHSDFMMHFLVTMLFKLAAPCF